MTTSPAGEYRTTSDNPYLNDVSSDIKISVGNDTIGQPRLRRCPICPDSCTRRRSGWDPQGAEILFGRGSGPAQVFRPPPGFVHREIRRLGCHLQMASVEATSQTRRLNVGRCELASGVASDGHTVPEGRRPAPPARLCDFPVSCTALGTVQSSLGAVARAPVDIVYFGVIFHRHPIEASMRPSPHRNTSRWEQSTFPSNPSIRCERGPDGRASHPVTLCGDARFAQQRVGVG